jgi:hypothetical protein
MSINTEFEQTEKFYNKIRVITGVVHYRNFDLSSTFEFKYRFVGVRKGNIIVFIPRLGYYKRANLTKLYKIMKGVTATITLNVHDLGIQRLTIHYWNEIKVDQELYKSFFPYMCNE